MIQVQTYTSDAPPTGEAFSNGGLAASPASREAKALTATPTASYLVLESEPAWPSECERLALINAVPGGLPSIGEQYLLEAFYLVAGARKRPASTIPACESKAAVL